MLLFSISVSLLKSKSLAEDPKYCICEDSGCPEESGCTAVNTISNFIGEGYIYKSGNYVIDLNENYQYSTSGNFQLLKIHPLASVTFTVKNSQTLADFKVSEVEGDPEYAIYFASDKYTSCNIDTFTGNVVLVDSTITATFNILASSDYSMIMQPDSTAPEKLDLFYTLNINFRSNGRILPLIQTASNCVSTIQGYTTSPSVSVRGFLLNLNDLGNSVNYLDTKYCICEDVDCSEHFECTPVRSIAQFVGEGYIYKHDYFIVDLDETYQYTTKDNIQLLTIHPCASAVTITVKNSKTFADLKLSQSGEDPRYGLYFSPEQQSTCNFDTVTGKVVMIDSLIPISLNVESESNYSMILQPDSAIPTTLDLFYTITINIHHGYLFPYIKTTSECSTTIKNYRTNPVLTVKGYLLNLDDFGNSIKYEETKYCICQETGCPIGQYCISVNSITDFIGIGYIYRSGNYEIDLNKDYQYLQHQLIIYVFASGTEFKVKNSQAFESKKIDNSNYYSLTFMDEYPQTCKIAETYPLWNYVSIISRLTCPVYIESKTTDYLALFKKPDAKTIKLLFNITIDFKVAGELNGGYYDESTGERQCYWGGLSKFRSEPTLFVTGYFTNPKQFLGFIQSDMISCICDSTGCPEDSSCNVVSSISDFKGRGFIYKSGVYELDLNQDSQFLPYYYNSKALTVYPSVPGISFKIKNSKSLISMRTSKWDENPEYYLFLGNNRLSACDISYALTGNDNFIIIDSEITVPVFIEATSDFSITSGPDPNSPNILSLFFSITIDFKEKGKLYPLVSTTVKDQEKTVCSYSMKDYKTAPILVVKELVTNPDDFGDSIEFQDLPTPTPTPSPAPTTKISNGSISPIAIVAIVIAAIAIVIAVVLGVLVLRKKNQTEFSSTIEQDLTV
jgi:hypothetical protein